MKPESKQTTYTTLDKGKTASPKVVFSITAIKWITAITDLHDKEVGILGVVKTLEDGSYYVDEIFYPKHQEMNSATCEISPEGEAQVAEWLINKGREDDIEKVRFWGHSHHTMGVGPSGQDETQAIERMERAKGFFIRGIFNKDGKMSISFYDYDGKRRFDNLKWEIEGDHADIEIRNKITEMMKDNVPTTTHVVTQNNWQEHECYNNYPGWQSRNYHHQNNFSNNTKGKGKGKGSKKNGKSGHGLNVNRSMSNAEINSMIHNWEGAPGAEMHDVEREGVDV